MAIDVYLQIDGIKGESSDSKHQGWLECEAVKVLQGDMAVLPAEGRGRRGRQHGWRVGPGDEPDRGVMRTLLLLALALPAVGQSAPIAVKPYYPTMSGETLFRYYLGHSEPRHESLKGGDYVNREMARGYMDGIKDMTEGTVWCNPGGNPDELNEDIAGAISKLPHLRDGVLFSIGGNLVLATQLIRCISGLALTP